MNLKNRDKILVCLMINIIIVVLVYNFLISPLSESISYKKAESIDYDKKIGELKSLDGNKHNLELKKAELEKKLEEVNKRIPNEKRVEDIINLIDTTAKENNVILTSYEYKDVPDKKGKDSTPLKIIEFNIEATGNTYSLMNFMYKLESDTRDIIVGKCAITSKTLDDKKVDGYGYINVPEAPKNKGSREILPGTISYDIADKPSSRFDKTNSDMQLNISAFYGFESMMEDLSKKDSSKDVNKNKENIKSSSRLINNYSYLANKIIGVGKKITMASSKIIEAGNKTLLTSINALFEDNNTILGYNIK